MLPILADMWRRHTANSSSLLYHVCSCHCSSAQYTLLFSHGNAEGKRYTMVVISVQLSFSNTPRNIHFFADLGMIYDWFREVSRRLNVSDNDDLPYEPA